MSPPAARRLLPEETRILPWGMVGMSTMAFGRYVISRWTLVAVVGTWWMAQYSYSGEGPRKAQLEAMERAKAKSWNYEVSDERTTPPHLRFDQEFQAGASCGPNSLYAVLRLCDIRCSYEDVLKEVPLDDSRGASLESLHQAAGHFGLSTEMRKNVAPEALLHAPKPAIVHMKSQGAGEQELEALDHFLVVTDFDEKVSTFRGVDTTSLRFVSLNDQNMARGMSGYCLFLTEKGFVVQSAGRPILAWGGLITVVVANVAFLVYRRRKG